MVTITYKAEQSDDIKFDCKLCNESFTKNLGGYKFMDMKEPNKKDQFKLFCFKCGDKYFSENKIDNYYWQKVMPRDV